MLKLSLALKQLTRGLRPQPETLRLSAVNLYNSLQLKATAELDEAGELPRGAHTAWAAPAAAQSGS